MMKPWVVLFLVLAHTAAARGPARTVVYSSECSCENDHGIARWRAKTDTSEPPTDFRNVQNVTPSEIFDWQGPGTIPRGGTRLGIETRWFALTGRLITLQAENDGDLHMVLVDASGTKPGKVIAEIPLGARWCKLRTLVFSWTNVVFPFQVTRDEYPFELTRHPIVTVVGKAFYDTDHSGKDFRNNRRPRAKDKAVWEVHPVMQLIVNETPPPPIASARTAAPQQAAPPVPVALATPTPPVDVIQMVTLVKPVKIAIPYGEMTLPAGRKLPVVAREGPNLKVKVLDFTASIPAASTDLK